MNFSTNLKPLRVCELLPLIALTLLLPFSAFAETETPAITSAEAMQKLENGNQRFLEGKKVSLDIDEARRKETAQKGQHPFATVITCSDSRLPVEIIFGQGIGDIFVIRVAGNVCNVDEAASAEYAADHLGTPVLVVLGHSKCGAVTAVAKGADLHGNLPALVRGIFPAVETAKKTHPGAEGDALVTAAIEANVWQSIEDLLKKSPIVAKRVRDEKLKIVGAVYDIEDGRVHWLGEHPNQAGLISSEANETH